MNESKTVASAGDNAGNALATALEAAGEIKVAPPKIAPGKTLVGIRLERPPVDDRHGKYTIPVEPSWRARGLAVAVRDGHLIESNVLIGHTSKGCPKVTGTHYVVCPQCGRQNTVAEAVWAAKDIGRGEGADEMVFKRLGRRGILSRWGRCPHCGVRWEEDNRTEELELSEFADKVLRDVEHMATVPGFVMPQAFRRKRTRQDDIPGWGWLQKAFRATGGDIALFSENDSGTTIIYNPGYWLGVVDDPHSTGLFFVEKNGDRREASLGEVESHINEDEIR